MPTAKKPVPPRKSLAPVISTPRETPEGTPQPNGPDILNQYEWTTAHPNLPFKSSSYFAIKAKHARSKKVPKQILLLEQTRGVITAEGSGSGTNTPAKKGKGTGGNTSTNGSTKNGKRKKVDPEPGPETEMEASVQQERGTAQDPEFKETQSGVDVSMQTEPPSTSTGPTQDPLLPRNGPPKRQVISYLTPQAPPSLFPSKKYCDITGLPASYTDPKTRLNFRGIEVLDIIRSLGPGQEQLYLAVRGAQQTLM